MRIADVTHVEYTRGAAKTSKVLERLRRTWQAGRSAKVGIAPAMRAQEGLSPRMHQHGHLTMHFRRIGVTVPGTFGSSTGGAVALP